MLKSNLLELLAAFSAKEIREFGEYVSSPIFNKNEAVLKLYEHIQKCYPDFDEKKMGKEYVFSKIFPDAEFNDGFMRTIMFNLNKLAEDYLKYSKFLNDEFTQDKYLMESYDEKRLQKQFEKKLKSTYDKLEKSVKSKDEHYFYRKYVLENMFNRYENKLMDSLLKVQHARYGDIGNESDNLIKFFMIALMRRYREMLNKRYVYKIDYSLKFIDELVNHLNQNKYDDIPLIEFYFRFIQLMEGIDEGKNYIFIKDFLLKNYKIFPNVEAYAYFICLCNVISQQKMDNWQNELFNMYKFTLEKNVYSNDGTGKITFIEFIAMLFTALRIKEYTWAESFVDKYKHKLPENEKQNAANFSYARLNFERGNFSKANEYLSKVHFEALFYKIWVKGLQIRIYYEMGWLNEAMNQIDSYRHFLSSNPLLTKQNVRANTNFIRLTKRLIAAKTYPEKKDIDTLRMDVEKEMSVNSKEWLLAKVDELIK